ncbi:hypothetical protein [Candidatus Leptofilum sp.]|uniref:hypothetical protein n=1 Tax=Candidatus Leptofilum sp. TaxID=3241576 RepID=UPI003B599E94
MTTRTIISRWLGLSKPQSATTAMTIHTPNGVILSEPEQAALIPHQPDPIIIPQQPNPPQTSTDTLSNFLRIGRLYHPLCRNAFVEKVQLGYYAYEQREEWHTCALAAAYAGAFGPQSIERPDFSYSMAIWRLSQRIGFNIGERQVIGPTGRHNNLADEMIKLVDDNLWTRAGVADWVASLGY